MIHRDCVTGLDMHWRVAKAMVARATVSISAWSAMRWATGAMTKSDDGVASDMSCRGTRCCWVCRTSKDASNGEKSGDGSYWLRCMESRTFLCSIRSG